MELGIFAAFYSKLEIIIIYTKMRANTQLKMPYIRFISTILLHFKIVVHAKTLQPEITKSFKWKVGQGHMRVTYLWVVIDVHC